MATLIDDFKAARLRRRLAHRDTNAELAALGEQLVTQLADVVFVATRPRPALNFATDEWLRDAARAWARTLADAATRDADDATPPPV